MCIYYCAPEMLANLKRTPGVKRDPREGQPLESKKLRQKLIFQSIKSSVQIQHKEPPEGSQAFFLLGKEERINVLILHSPEVITYIYLCTHLYIIFIIIISDLFLVDK